MPTLLLVTDARCAPIAAAIPFAFATDVIGLVKSAMLPIYSKPGRWLGGPSSRMGRRLLHQS